MQIEITELEPHKLSVQYIADASEILAKRSEVLNHFKNAPVPGNRPNKASLDAIRVHYRDQIEESLKRALAEDAYHNTLFEKKLRPHGAPKFNSLLLADGKFTCNFELFTKPDFELAQYEGMQLPKPHESINATELAEKMLQELRVRFGEAEPYTDSDFVQTGDNIIVDYEGKIDGVKIDSLSAQGEMLTVGVSQVPGFDDNLLGMKLEETREFDITVPENGLPSVVGKTVKFIVTLNMGSKVIPCALDDELAKKFNRETLEELREDIKKSASSKIMEGSRNSLLEAVAAKLTEDNKFDVPNWLTLSEAQYLAFNSKIDWNALPDIDKEQYMKMAEKNVRLALVLDKIREVDPEAQLSDQEIFDIIKQNLMKSKTNTSLDDVIKEMNRTGYLQILFSRIRDEHTLDVVVKKAKIIE